jgi:excisionase family DNA binding protein
VSAIVMSTAHAEEKTADWLTVTQVADLLQVSSRTIQRLVKPSAGRDRLLAVRIGGVIRVRRTVLDQYLRAREGRA